jgi:hypothetical protein
VTDIAIEPGESVQPPSPTYRSVLGQSPVRIVATSRFLSRAAGQILGYGIIVSLAAAGSSQFEISVAKSAQYVAALLFGFQGGMLADSRPKRQILWVSFLILAAVCIVTPFLLGTSSGDLLFIIFVSSAMGQIVGPGLKSIVAIVSSPAELATTGALVNIVGSIGSSVGSTFIAPFLIKRSGIDAVLIASGVIYLFSAIRIFQLPSAEAMGKEEASRNLRDLDWKPRALSLRYNANWIYANRPIASMLIVGAFSASLLQGVTTLVPIYVRDVLDADPTNSVYIFILSGVGFFVAAAVSPNLINRYGERKTAVWSLVLMALSVALFSVIFLVDEPLAFISPLRLINVFSETDLSDAILAAGLIAFPANFGSTMCLQSVQVFINRNVAQDRQGGVFGLEQVQQNALNLVVVLLLGVLALLTGPQYVFLFAPIVVAVLGYAFLVYAFRHATGRAPRPGETIDFLLHDMPVPAGDADFTGGENR